MGKLRARRAHVMNAFVEHHAPSIQFGYRCFDRLLLNGLIQPFQQPERVIGFFNAYRGGQRVTRDLLRDVAAQFHHWVTTRVRHCGAPLLDAPEGRRDDFVAPYFQRAQPDQIVVILKAREPARILIAQGNKTDDRWHLQLVQRWVVQYNFYINDRQWGRLFVRMCPYFPFSARVCLNQHHWLATRLRAEGIGFRQCANAFVACRNPQRLQELADALTARDLLRCGQKWLTYLTPFFTARERQHAGCQHRLFFAQVEYCDNLLFHRRAALDGLGQRLLDANRTIGQPNKIATIFGRKVTRRYRGELKTVIEDLDLPNPVIRSHYRHGFIKQYVRDHLLLRTEPATNNVADYGVPKADLHPHTVDALGASGATYRLASLRYDLSKLRAKALVEKLPHTRSYRLTKTGYSICLVFLKLFERIYAPLTAGLLRPLAGAAALPPSKRSQLDRLYQRIVDDVDQLFHAVGLKIAA